MFILLFLCLEFWICSFSENSVRMCVNMWKNQNLLSIDVNLWLNWSCFKTQNHVSMLNMWTDKMICYYVEVTMKKTIKMKNSSTDDQHVSCDIELLSCTPKPFFFVVSVLYVFLFLEFGWLKKVVVQFHLWIDQWRDKLLFDSVNNFILR